MEIRNRESGAVTTVSQFKASYPNTSFPKVITNDILDSYGYDPVLNGAAATVTAPYGVIPVMALKRLTVSGLPALLLVRSSPILKAVKLLLSRRLHIVQELMQKWLRASAQNAIKSLQIRDWTQLADSSANATAWGTYRQALRDLPTTSGDDWPHNVTWPTEPS